MGNIEDKDRTTIEQPSPAGSEGVDPSTWADAEDHVMDNNDEGDAELLFDTVEGDPVKSDIATPFYSYHMEKAIEQVCSRSNEH